MAWIIALLVVIAVLLLLIFGGIMAIDKRMTEQWEELELFIACIQEGVEDYGISESKERTGGD